MNDFDRGGRYAVKGEPGGTQQWLFPRLRRLRYNGWLDSQSAPRPGELDRRCDTIAELLDDEGPAWACVIELFTEPDADAVDRSLEYVARFRREMRHGPHGRDRYQFIVALIFLTGSSRETSLSMNLPGMEELGLWFQPRVMDVSAEDAVAHLEAIEQNRLARGLLAWVPLMRHGQSEDIVARWRAQVELEPNAQRGKTLADVALSFSWLTDSRDVWMKGLEGLMLKRSPYLEEARDEARIEMRRQDTLDVLEERFPGQVPSNVVERIKTETDLAKLGQWLKSASTATLEKFQEGLG